MKQGLLGLQNQSMASPVLPFPLELLSKPQQPAVSPETKSTFEGEAKHFPILLILQKKKSFKLKVGFELLTLEVPSPVVTLSVLVWDQEGMDILPILRAL